MRVLVTALVAMAVLYFWDKESNNGRFLDGLHSMWSAISHNMFP